MGQQVYKYRNLLNRDFHAVSLKAIDISYIYTKQGVLYLSMIRISMTMQRQRVSSLFYPQNRMYRPV